MDFGPLQCLDFASRGRVHESLLCGQSNLVKMDCFSSFRLSGHVRVSIYLIVVVLTSLIKFLPNLSVQEFWKILVGNYVSFVKCFTWLNFKESSLLQFCRSVIRHKVITIYLQNILNWVKLKLYLSNKCKNFSLTIVLVFHT